MFMMADERAKILKRCARASMLLLVLAGATHANPDHSGNYVLLQQTTVVAKVPILADVVSTTRAVSVQRLRQEGERLRGMGQLCDISIESSSSLIRTELPSAFKRALPPVRTDARLIERGSQLAFRQGSQTLIMGAELENPAKDSLPTSAHDRRVRDTDGDGKPGVTVRVHGIVSGEVYVAQRSSSSLEGVKKANGFSGMVRFQTEESILGASKGALKKHVETRTNPERSFFRMVRVPESTSCEQAVKLAASWR